jgi:hypothetical protein
MKTAVTRLVMYRNMFGRCVYCDINVGLGFSRLKYCRNDTGPSLASVAKHENDKPDAVCPYYLCPLKCEWLFRLPSISSPLQWLAKNGQTAKSRLGSRSPFQEQDLEGYLSTRFRLSRRKPAQKRYQRAETLETRVFVTRLRYVRSTE